MIRVLRTGQYNLIATREFSRLLILDGKTIYEWITWKGVGELNLSARKITQTESVLSMGKYRLYEVKNEPSITEMIHLELLVGIGKWQGYLLPDGLPAIQDKKVRITSTSERITRSLVDRSGHDYSTSSFSRFSIL